MSKADKQGSEHLPLRRVTLIEGTPYSEHLLVSQLWIIAVPSSTRVLLLAGLIQDLAKTVYLSRFHGWCLKSGAYKVKLCSSATC